MTDYIDVFENRVRFTEVDMQGIVFYGHYFLYQDEAFSAYFRVLDEVDPDLEDSDWQVHVVNVEMDYRSKAEYGDVLVNAMRVDRIGNSSIEWRYRSRQKASDRIVVEGSLTQVAVDRESGETIRVPDTFRDAVREIQDVPPTEE